MHSDTGDHDAVQDMAPVQTRPVFHDPHKRRWRVVSAVGRGVGLVATAVLAVTIVSTLLNPALPKLGLHQISFLPRGVRMLAGPAPSAAQQSRQGGLDYQHDEKPLLAAVRKLGLAPKTVHRSKLIGFYVNWDDASLQSLKANLSAFDMLVPEWLHVAGPSAAISADDSATAAATLGYIRARRPGLPVVPLVNNYDQATQSWDSADLERNLHSPASRARIVDGLLGYVQSQRLAGINVDFENLSPSARNDLTAFMADIYARFHPLGLTVTQSVPADNPAYDYAALSKNADMIMIMAYDQHYPGGPAGPVAAQSWFDSTIAKRLSQVPASKLVVGVGSYGYDWSEKRGSVAQAVNFEQANAIAKAAGVKPSLDPASLNLHFDYVDASGVTHHVWVLDAVSAFDEIASAEKARPAGYALWRLGSEDPTIWNVFEDRDSLDAAAAREMDRLDFSNGVAYEGQGEILRVTGMPVKGARSVGFDPTVGAITAETIDRPAQPYVITRWGGGGAKTIALTFDDGPDPYWTPRILDVLDLNNVPATFFVIGMNADGQRAIMQREYRIGEEIGNHTFTHPDISAIPPAEARMQLDATQRLFESQLGVRSVLFRPPYGEDAEPNTPRQVEPLLQTGRMGYYTVGMGVDPNDWARPGSQAIVDRTIAQIENGRGHIVLLHDGGGDRSQTLEALPQIIKELRSRGYRFVTVSQLVGMSRAQVMPATPPSDRLLASVDGASFTALDWGRVALYWLFMAGIVTGIGRLVFLGTLAIVERVRDHRSNKRFSEEYRPLVSVVVPAYNEEAVVEHSVRAVLASDYDKLEVIVVDDGSSDSTYDIARAAFADDPRVTVLTKANGGKAKALNFGIAHAHGEIVIGMDADTLFARAAIGRMVRHFEDPNIGAVAGNAKVGNRINLLTRWQALEYITNQNLERRAFDLLNCITVVPGAIGAWRRDAIVGAGGFTDHTLAEDADLTLCVLEAGARVAYEDSAYAYTESPDTVHGFVKQRSRWVFGTMQTFWKHRTDMFRSGLGTLGTVAMPSVLIFQILFPLISPVMDLMMIGSIAGIWVQRFQHPTDPGSGNFEHILWFYALFVAIDLATAALAFLLEGDEDWRLLPWLLLQRFFYRQLMYFVVWKASINAIRGSIVGWHKVDRKATARLGED